MANAVVLFDSHCPFCAKSVEFIIKRDPHGHFRFASIYSEAGKKLLASCGIPTENVGSLVLIEEGKCLRKSDAAIEIARGLAKPWPTASVFGFIPKYVRDRVYDLIARNRNHLASRSDSAVDCPLPTLEIRRRFID